MDVGIRLGKKSDVGKFSGLEIGLINNVAHGEGIQIGLANINSTESIFEHSHFSGVQISGNNHQDGKIKGLQLAVMTNITEETEGIQLSMGVNMIEPYNYSFSESKAVQIGPVNICSSRLRGVQIGLLCYAEEGKFLQLGLLTVRGGEKPWYKRVTPFVGYSDNENY